MPPRLQVRSLKAKKSAPPAVATVAASAEPAQLQAPIGTSWFWGGSAGAGGQGVPPNPDAQALLPLYSHLPFRQALAGGLPPAHR